MSLESRTQIARAFIAGAPCGGFPESMIAGGRRRTIGGNVV